MSGGYQQNWDANGKVGIPSNSGRQELLQFCKADGIGLACDVYEDVIAFENDLIGRGGVIQALALIVDQLGAVPGGRGPAGGGGGGDDYGDEENDAEGSAEEAAAWGFGVIQCYGGLGGHVGIVSVRGFAEQGKSFGDWWDRSFDSPHSGHFSGVARRS